MYLRLFTFFNALSAVLNRNGLGVVVMKSSFVDFSHRFLFSMGLRPLCLSEELTDGMPGDGSIGRSLCAAGVDSLLRSLIAIVPG